MWWGHGFGWEWTMFGGLMILLVWGGLIAVIIVAVRALIGPSSQLPRGQGRSSETALNNPLNILKTRYARGEISKTEYEEMRDELQIS